MPSDSRQPGMHRHTSSISLSPFVNPAAGDLVHVVDAFLLQNTDMHPSGRRQVRPGLSINVPTWHAYILALVG